jgi:hypothetical protein
MLPLLPDNPMDTVLLLRVFLLLNAIAENYCWPDQH